ncbi:MAG: methyl-accepting chemotaxis protein [Pseudomonadota bacterium]
MAKQSSSVKSPTLPRLLLPILLVAAAATVWFGFSGAGTGGDTLSSRDALIAVRAEQAVAGSNGALGNLASVVRSSAPSGTIGEQARNILSNQERLRAFNDAAERFVSALDAMEVRVETLPSEENPAIADLATGLAALRTDYAAMRGTPANATAIGEQLVSSAAAVSRLVDALTGYGDPVSVTDALTPESGYDVQLLSDEAASIALSEQMLVVRGAADALASDAVALARSGEAADAISRAVAGAAGNAANSGSSSGLAATLDPLMPWLPLGLLAAALVLSLMMLASASRDAKLRRVASQLSEQNERNQQAILRLLDELGSLADGDLTVEATVTGDITDTIADSINFAIEALRELVTTIDGTAAMVDSATRQTESTAVHMNRAAQKQALEIAAATESIAAIAASIEEVSGNAERSSDVARHSVDVAHKGGDAVRRTIEGMNTIRETIQDTSKRIKRLGESSQEIGNIVELINDIAEQTNILALNASIQASMAGEAGRGFAVVADEVQRLAERSTNATKQIEVLVRTIQSDTNEAVVSMERSTTDVVGGALLAENAGAALDEIEQVSNQIASLVQNIYSSARQQSQAASDINRRTVSLKEISGQTGKAASATTSSIAKLAQLAGELRKSVSGFRLPESGNVTRITRPADTPSADDVSTREVG